MLDKKQNYSKLPWKIAAPSFIWPGTVGQNCFALEALVQEVGLAFFETQSCLDYTEKDLPHELKDLDLDYHVHLPLDLPWEKGMDILSRQVRDLLAKVDFLSPRGYVLHPPFSEQQLCDFVKIWQSWGLDPKILFLENVENQDLSTIWGIIEAHNLSLCLDLGHMLVYKQQKILNYEQVWERTRLLHIYAPIGGHKHHSLAKLDKSGQKILEYMLKNIRQDCTVLLEVFSPHAFQESMQTLDDWARSWGLTHQ